MNRRMIDSEKTCERIKAIMEERNISPRQMQRAMGFDSIQAIYKWLSPKSKTIPSIDSLAQLTNFLGCQMEDVLVFRYSDD